MAVPAPWNPLTRVTPVEIEAERGSHDSLLDFLLPSGRVRRVRKLLDRHPAVPRQGNGIWSASLIGAF
jgi:hypothetical protein